MKVAVCVPIYGGHVHALFSRSLFELAVYATGHTAPNGEVMELKMLLASGLLPKSRNDIATEAMKWGADWLLWLDSDMTFPAVALHALLSRNLPLVGVNYRMRVGGGWTGNVEVRGERRELVTDAAKAEAKLVEPVLRLGLGVVLAHADVFRAIDGLPFLFTNTADEDEYFMRKAASVGFQPHVDHQLSAHVGHLAETVLRAF